MVISIFWLIMFKIIEQKKLLDSNKVFRYNQDPTLD